VLISAELVDPGMVFGKDEVGVDGAKRRDVDGDSPGCKLLGPTSRHGVQGGLGTAIEVGGPEAHADHDGADIDDAGVGGGQVRLGGLDQQEDAADVDVEDGVKALDRCFSEARVRGDGACIVDDDVDSSAREGREGGIDDVLAKGQARGIRLDGGYLDAGLPDSLGRFQRRILVAVIVENNVCTLLCKSVGGRKTNAILLRNTSDNGNVVNRVL
jgi:hypothetical protein